MHIAFLTPEYPHNKTSKSAGIGTSIYNSATELIRNKHQVTVFVYAQDSDEEFKDSGINIVKIAFKKYVILGWFLQRKHIERVINKHILKSVINLVEAPDWTGITAFMKLKAKLVIRLHGSDTYFCHLENRKQKKKNFWFEKLALINANSIVAVSQFTANETINLFNLRKSISVIHNGINIDKFQSSNKNICIPNSVLYFGTIIRKKGVLELANIFNEVIKSNPSATLTLIGKDVIDVLENKSTKQLFKDRLSRDAINNVLFIEEVPYHEIKQHISKASVVVLPSFAEAFPMTWLEAMAMGKGMVTSNIGWATELMIDGETGFCVHPTNHKKYAQKIVELLSNTLLNQNFGEKAILRIKENFSKEIIYKKNIEYFQTVCNIK